MATLFDTLKKTLAEQPAAQPQSQQAQIQATIAAKGGKADVGGTTPKASNLGEQNALAITGAGLAQTALAGKVAASDLTGKEEALAADDATFQARMAGQKAQAEDQLATQAATTREGLAAKQDLAHQQTQANEEMRTSQINAAASNKLKELATQRGVELDDIFSEFERSNKELEFRKDAAQLEQLGFLLAMQDKSYLDELDRVGRERGLRDEVAFREEAQRLALGNELSDLWSKLGFQTSYNATQREMEIALGKLDINSALALSNAAIRDSNNAAMVQGGVDTLKAGADIASKHPELFKTEGDFNGDGGGGGGGSGGKRTPGAY